MAALRRKGALSFQQISLLIEYVKSFPCIWNPDHELYIHRGTIASAWTEIAKRLQLPENVLRTKWKNLRDLFVREIKRTNITSPDDYHGRWRHFKSLWFLHRADTEQALCEDGSETSDVLEPVQECDVKIEPVDEVNEFVFLDTEEENGRLDKPSEKQLGDISDIFTFEPKRRRMKEEYTEEDCDTMFLISLTPYFKLLEPIRKLVVRSKMQEIILKEIEGSTVNGQL